MKTRVCVDLNGVLVDTKQGICNRLEQDLGIKAWPRTFGKHLVGTAMNNIISGGSPKRLTKKAYGGLLDRMFNSAFLEVPPMKGASEGMKVLAAAGLELVVVTSAHTVSRELTEVWLDQNGFSEGEKPLDVIFTRKAVSKETQQCRCDVVVDNEVEQLVPLLERPDTPILVHFIPEDVPKAAIPPSPDPRIIQMHGWGQVGKLIEMVAGPVAE